MKKVFICFVFIPVFGISQQIDSVLVGFGGGITGHKKVYKVSKCIINKGVGVTGIRYVDSVRIKKQVFKKIIADSRYIYATIVEFSYPSNHYKFVKIYSNSEVNEYTWGGTDFQAPEKVINLYYEIIDVIRESKLNN